MSPNIDFSQVAGYKSLLSLTRQSRIVRLSSFSLLINEWHLSSRSFWFNSVSMVEYLLTKEKCFSCSFWLCQPHTPPPATQSLFWSGRTFCEHSSTLWPWACLFSWNYLCLAQTSSFDSGRISGSEKAGLVLGLGLEFETQQIILLTLPLFANFMKFKKSFLGNGTNLLAKSWDGPRKM